MFPGEKGTTSNTYVIKPFSSYASSEETTNKNDEGGI